MDGEYWYNYVKEHNPSVLGTYIIEYVEKLKTDKKELEKQLLINGVVKAKPEKVCELIRQKFDDWVFGLETQAGEKLKVVDSTDFNEIITEIESELKDL